MNDIEWISSFTGMPVADPKAPKDSTPPKKGVEPVDPIAAADAFEEDERRKALLLAEVRKDIAVIKGKYQKAMQQEVTLKETYIANWHKKGKLLNVEGTQLDEADFEELLITEETEFAPGTQAVISAGNLVIAECHEKLKNAKNAAGKDLFTKPELESEFWTPLMRERVLPETYIADAYSLTRRMIDETNALYIEESDKRTKEGQATARKSGASRALTGTSKALNVAGSIAANFGENGKIASMALKGMGQLIETGQGLAEKIEKAEWGDVASIGMTALKGLTTSLLTAFGIPEGVTKAVDSGFDAGSAVARAGGHFAKGPDGVAEGVTCLVEALGGALSAGASATDGDKQQHAKQVLDDLSKFLPGAITAAVRGGQMAKHVRDGDSEAAMRALNAALTEGFKLARAAQLKDATKDMSEEEAEEYEKQFEEDNADLEASLDSILESSPEVAARMAEKSRMGQHRAGIDELIADMADALESAAAAAGLDADLANDLGTLLPSLVKADTVLDILFKEDFNATAAAAPLAAALRDSFADVAKVLPTLANEADTRAKAITSLAAGLNSKMQSTLELLKQQKAAKRSYEDLVNTFIDGMRNGMTAALALDGLTTALRSANTGTFAKQAQDEVAKKKLALAQTEVNAELEEMQAELDGMTKAQQAGADASGIDALISKLVRDRLIMKMAVNVVAGGADMLSKVVPGLAIGSAGVRMVGHLIAAAQRAQQLKRWIDSRDDFEAAQSALSSASRNFVKNQAEQLSDHSIDAALELARLIAAAAELAGPAAAGGAIAKNAIEAVSKVKALIKTFYAEIELERAWSLFQKSMANPANRRLALQVRQTHPTLAKYTIAWGAQVKGDLLARNALRACGLNEASLNNADSGVGKVVQYLEVFYEEDRQLYRSLDNALEWVPEPLELTSRSWVKLKMAAQANKLWDSPSTGTIDGLLVKLAETTKAVDLANDKLAAVDENKGSATAADVEPCRVALLAQRDVLGRLAQALDGVAPAGAKADAKALETFKATALAGLAAKARAQDKMAATALTDAENRISALKAKPKPELQPGGKEKVGV